MKQFKYMVTHNGSAHQDDLNAIRLALGAGLVTRVVRHPPTAAELEDPDVLVCDVGGEYCPEKGNFDHHQLGRDALADCSAWQLARYLGVHEQLCQLYPWWGYIGVFDSKGPGALAKMVGLPTDELVRLIDLGGSNRMITDRLAEFGTEDALAPCATADGLFCTQLADEGYAMLEACRKFADWMADPTVELTPLFTSGHGDQIITTKQVRCLDLAGIHEPPPLSFLKLWEAEQTAKLPGDKRIVGSILPSERGGWALYRNDNVKGSVDLSKLEGMAEVAFAHKGGFIATTKADVGFMQAVRLYRLALVEPVVPSVTLVPGSGPAINDPPALAAKPMALPIDEE